MKHAKILGLAVMALAALMAMTGTASATILTSPSGTTYTSEIKSENEGSITLTSEAGFFGNITCKKSTVAGKVETHGTSVTAGGKISSLTFTECSGGTPVSPVAKPGSLEVHGTSTTGNGTLTSSGAEVIVNGTAVGTCVFVTKETDIGTLTGSNITKGNATLDIAATIKNNGSNPFCGTNSTWEGSYKVTTPSTLEVH